MQIADIKRNIEFLIITPLLAKGGDEATRGIKELNSVDVRVGHRDASIGSTTHSLWIIELSLLIASVTVYSSNGIEWNW